MEKPTPLNVMFEAFKTFGPLSYKKLATIILSDRPIFEGRSPRSRVSDRTWVSRYLVNAPIGIVYDSFFDDFEYSAHSVVATLKSRHELNHTADQIFKFFGEGAALKAMKQALDAYDLNSSIYQNVLDRIMQLKEERESVALLLLMMQFLATGCLNNARKAADYTLNYAKNTLDGGFNTTLMIGDSRRTDKSKDEVNLCLIRMRNGRLSGKPFRLNTSEEGTEIGLLSTKEHSLSDVEDTVSGRHLRVYCDSEGQWFAEGLNSKNGSVLIRGDSNKELLIEPPRAQRKDFIARSVEIHPGDKLVLARDTVFMVLESVVE